MLYYLVSGCGLSALLLPSRVKTLHYIVNSMNGHVVQGFSPAEPLASPYPLLSEGLSSVVLVSVALVSVALSSVVLVSDTLASGLRPLVLAFRLPSSDL